MPEHTQAQINEERKTFPQNIWKVFIIEAFLFLLTMGLGIVTAFRINEIVTVKRIDIPQIPFLQFIIQFFLATLFIYLLIHFIKLKKQKSTIFKVLFVLAVFWGGMLVINSWIPGTPSFLLMGFLIIWWWKKPLILIQDLCIMLGIAGAGSMLGLAFSPEAVIIFLIIFSIYDLIAVYKTKHMVEMAKEMIKSKAILGMIIPPDFSGFQESLKEIKPGGRFLILGGGDIVFPLFLCSSLIPSGIFNSLIVAFFSLFGLFVSFWFFVSQKKRKPIPALPPIAFFSILGYLMTKILY